MGAVKNKTSTMGIGMLKMSGDFYTAVDFMGLIGPYEVKVAQRRPRPLKPYWVGPLKEILSIQQMSFHI